MPKRYPSYYVRIMLYWRCRISSAIRKARENIKRKCTCTRRINRKLLPTIIHGWTVAVDFRVSVCTTGTRTRGFAFRHFFKNGYFRTRANQLDAKPFIYLTADKTLKRTRLFFFFFLHRKQTPGAQRKQLPGTGGGATADVRIIVW